MRELIPQLDFINVDTMLIDVQSPLGLSVLPRFDFRTTPTYILYDAQGAEVWRSSTTPDHVLIQALFDEP